jgi:hypothetical protein
VARRASVACASTLALLMLLPTAPTYAFAQVAPGDGNIADFDARTGRVLPTSAQLSQVAALSAHVEWNAFGTPHSLIRYGGYLSSTIGGATAADAARSWVDAHKSLFKLSSTATSVLETVADNQLVKSNGHAVLFRQKFGGVPAVQDGMITVGIVGSPGSWKVAYVSSTSAGTQTGPIPALITPLQAWIAAAKDVGLPGIAANIAKVHTEQDWTVFSVKGYPQLQRARLRALPIPGQGVRPVFETDVQKVLGGQAIAYISLVDAVSKKVWFRSNAVDQDAAGPSAAQPARITTAYDAPVTGMFSGTTGASGACGRDAPITTAAGTQTVDVVASANIPANDIVLKLIYNGTTVASSDTATSPEAVHYAPAGGVPAGSYAARVCPFDATSAAFDYTGLWVTNDQAVAQVPYPPEWQNFSSSPKLDYSNTDARIKSCWQKTASAADCNVVVGNTASRSPWDVIVETGAPSFTSIGNNAKTAEAWLSPLTPGENYAPTSADRKYYFPWTNQWYTSKCNPTSFASPSRNDVDASIINLFVGHNRMHDFSYNLGFTETTWNLQQSNFGNGQPGPYPNNEDDPEIGNVQAGAVTGGNPSFEGRDNANQITLQDGIPGITNQYLFQPIAGAFYAPCVDGDLDMTVWGHEYTHAISNRMVGGPDSNLSGNQAGAMGEAWGDLDALEYLHEFGYAGFGGANEWALGPYVTGNKQVGIRNYALNANPLNYSDIGYDSACNSNLVGPPAEPTCASISEVHADGEIWNAVNFDIRAALVKKYKASYPASNATVQAACGNGLRAPNTCPGNRRWIQIVFDAFLLMPPDVSMLGARDAYLAADVMRFAGANQKQLWRAFASRGMGQTAATNGTDDDNPTPGWSSPKQKNGKLTFKAVNEAGQSVSATVYVGDYEARITPAADTTTATPLGNAISIVPGTYEMVAVAPGYGHLRFKTTVQAKSATLTLHFFSNWTSAAKGANASGDGGNFADLIDDTEGTNWAYVGTDSVKGKAVQVKLAAAKTIDVVQVSAMLHQADDDDDYDASGQNRFTALKSFEIWECLGSAANNLCSGSNGWVKTGTFNNAFTAGLPRPLMPNMLIKQFDVTNMKADFVRLVVVDNQCTGTAAYHGEQDNDPLNDTDCVSASDADNTVRVAELQAFSGRPYVSGGYKTRTVAAGADAVAAGGDTTVQP